MPALHAAEKQYVAGQIIAVEKKFHERVLYYLVNTPVTQEDPYYELSLRSGDLVLLTEFTPRHAADELPEGWTGGSKVEMKVTDKHHVMVRQPEGIELQLLIVKRRSSQCSRWLQNLRLIRTEPDFCSQTVSISCSLFLFS